MRFPPGHRKGVHQIPGLIGVGGWGEVYRAQDDQVGRDVQINVMPPPRTADPDRLERLQPEAQALAALNRPPNARIFGLEPHGDNRAVAMERMDGPTLTDAMGGRESARARMEVIRGTAAPANP